MKDKANGTQREQTLTHLVTCPLCRRLLTKPRALACGVCCACEACVNSVRGGVSDASDGDGGGNSRCHCGRATSPADAESALPDAAREQLVRLYAQLASQGQLPDDEAEVARNDEAKEVANVPPRLDRWAPGNRAARLAALERRLKAWERAHLVEAEAAATALDAAERALTEARGRLAKAAASGRDALEAARLRVRVAREGDAAAEATDPPLPMLPPPPGGLARWAAGLTGHVTEGLQDASGPATMGCRPTEPPLIGRRSIALAGYQAVAACGVTCTTGYHSDAGGQVFETAAVADAAELELSIVGRQPLPSVCIAILLRRQRQPRMLRRQRRHQRMLSETGRRLVEEASECRILLLDCQDVGSLSSVPLNWTPVPALAASRPLRLAGCPSAAQLFLLLTPRRRRRRPQRRLLVCQCGLDGRPAQTVELRDFRRGDGAGECNDGADEAAGDDDQEEEEEEETEEDNCYSDVRIESNAKHVVVFSGGSASSDAAPSVVVLLDRISLRALQRLQLPDAAVALHATPAAVWMRLAGRVKLVSQASRQVGRDWPAARLCGLFYASDAAAGSDGGLAVATENCVRLFDRELQPLCRIGASGGQSYRLQHPVAVCRVRRGGGDSVLAVCDAAANEVLLFALE